MYLLANYYFGGLRTSAILNHQPQSSSLEMKDGEVKGEVTLKAEENEHWSWLKPEEDKEKKTKTNTT